MKTRLNPKEAMLIVLYQDPELAIHKMWNYSFRYYLLFATHNRSEYDNDPYYLVNKYSGIIRKYSCGESLMKFFRVTDKKPLAERRHN